MSQKSTSRTQELFLDKLPNVLADNTSERWDACMELAAEAKELSLADKVDEQAIVEIAEANARTHGVEFGAAERVARTTRRPLGGLAAMHAPSHRVWQGTGSCIATVGVDIVDYFNQPGIVEEKYGPAFPFIIAKLGWSAALAGEGMEVQDNRGGYQRVREELYTRKQLKPMQLQHIGSIARFGESQLIDNKLSRPFYLASASGTLPEPWVHLQHGYLPGYKDREASDEAAGLLDGSPQNLRAGLYDVTFADMVIDEMLGQNYDGSTLGIFEPKHYEGVDIN